MSVKIIILSIFLAILMTLMTFVPQTAQAHYADVIHMPMTGQLASSSAISEDSLLTAGINTMSLMTGIFTLGLDIAMDDLSGRQNAIALDSTIDAFSTVSYPGQQGNGGFNGTNSNWSEAIK
ncbi:hypothetical protein ACFLWS_05410, partial [Chloroflexota bacterium]